MLQGHFTSTGTSVTKMLTDLAIIFHMLSYLNNPSEYIIHQSPSHCFSLEYYFWSHSLYKNRWSNLYGLSRVTGMSLGNCFCVIATNWIPFTALLLEQQQKSRRWTSYRHSWQEVRAYQTILWDGSSGREQTQIREITLGVEHSVEQIDGSLMDTNPSSQVWPTCPITS